MKQLSNIALILICYAFMLSVSYILWTGITNLSDAYHEGVWFIKEEPIWLSSYDIMI